jgi:hypothetical protein
MLVAAPQAGAGIAMLAGAKLLWVDPGLHRLTVAPMSITPSAAGGMSLPAVLVAVPYAEGRVSVEIVGEHGTGNWIGVGGGTVVLRSPAAGGQVLVTAYALLDQATRPLEIDLHPIDA